MQFACFTGILDQYQTCSFIFQLLKSLLVGAHSLLYWSLEHCVVLQNPLCLQAVTPQSHCFGQCEYLQRC